MTLQNLPNKIHGPQHGLGHGRTVITGQNLRVEYDKTNAIFSRFRWKGP